METKSGYCRIQQNSLCQNEYRLFRAGQSGSSSCFSQRINRPLSFKKENDSEKLRVAQSLNIFLKATSSEKQ